jgi:hypothetical protein
LIVCRAVRNDKIRGLKNRQEFVVCESVAGCGVYCCNLADVGATDFVWMTARKEEGGAAADTTSRACRWSETKKKKKLPMRGAVQRARMVMMMSGDYGGAKLRRCSDSSKKRERS